MNPTTLTGGKNGTKWIGGIFAAAGVLSQMDPSLFPPSWLPWVLMAGGIANVVRGSVNTANIKTQPPGS